MGRTNIPPAAQSSSELMASGAMGQKPVGVANVGGSNNITSHPEEGGMASGGSGYSDPAIVNGSAEDALFGNTKSGLQTGLEGASLDRQGLIGTTLQASEFNDVTKVLGDTFEQNGPLKSVNAIGQELVRQSHGGDNLQLKPLDLVERSHTITKNENTGGAQGHSL